MKAYLFLTTGFEESEAVGTMDVLRRGDIDAITVSMTGDRTVVSAHKIPIVADDLFENINCDLADVLILPGGSIKLNEYQALREAIVKHYNAGKLVAAICAAPYILGNLGLLKGKRATCYPGIEQHLTGATIVNEPTVTDGNIITGRGPGMAFAFGLAILKYLKGNACAADDVAEGMLL